MTAKELIEKIENLTDAEYVTLRRASGRRLQDCSLQTRRVFFSLFGENPPSQIDKWFTVACVHCLWDKNTKKRIPLPEAMAILQNDAERNAPQHRFERLIDCRWDTSGHAVTILDALARLIKHHELAIDCEDLLLTLLSWEDGTKRWVDAYCKKLAS